jgi:hypothetical protein
VFFVVHVIKEGTVSELSTDELRLEECERLHASLRPRIPNNSYIRNMLGSPTLTLMATLCASTMPHASTVSNASAKIVLASIAVETVVVVEPVVSAENAERLGGRSKDHQFPVGIGRESRPRAPDCRLVQKAELGAMFKPVKPVRRANLAVI